MRVPYHWLESYCPSGLGPVDLADRLTMTGTKMEHVVFKETSQLYTSVSTGDIQFALGSAATAGPLYRAGKLPFPEGAIIARLAWDHVPFFRGFRDSHKLLALLARGGAFDVFGRTDNFGGTVASPAAGWVNGQILRANGGLV